MAYNPNEKRDSQGRWTEGLVDKRALNAVQNEQDAQERALIAKVRANPKRLNESDKDYSKRVIDQLPNPEELPEEMALYFNTGKGDLVSVKDLIGEERGAKTDNAAKRMWAASKGLLSKRDPISVEKVGDKYKVLDGNTTLAAAKKYGWKKIIVNVQK